MVLGAVLSGLCVVIGSVAIHRPLLIALAGSLGASLVALAIHLRQRSQILRREVHELANQVATITDCRGWHLELPRTFELQELVEALKTLRLQLTRQGSVGNVSAVSVLTRSGLFESFEVGSEPSADTLNSGLFTTMDMVNRLDPRELKWLDSSPAEQAFLGWTLDQLKEKSFLEILRPDHRELAREQLLGALAKGEAHGLVYGIRTADGEPKAIEMNVGARCGPDGAISHLRCHLRDVTERLRASRDLRRRTRQLTQANEQLRQANRELRELKDRYSDLYHNAPTFYFSLDNEGRFLVCNDTMVRALGYSSTELIGRSYATILTEVHRPCFPERFTRFLQVGHLEVESRWIKADGSLIDVWINATAVRGPDGEITHSRSAATDITARKTLEAQLREKNDDLASTIEELSRKNRELDDFTHVVSHDLREPLRTLIAFSGYLLQDHSGQLDAEGLEYAGHLRSAASRMRSLIDDLLTHSRAGRVIGAFREVDLEDVLRQLRADLADAIGSRNAEIIVHGPLSILLGDRDRIAQLVANLIGNGLKYNRSETPRIEVSATPDEADPSWAILRIKDNGIGIDPRHHEDIFQVFRRLHAKDEYEGTGAGLSICRKIVEAHGGRIWVESEPGQGATFLVRLPRLAETRQELGSTKS